MNRGLSDTHPDAERVQIALLRQATPAQRFALLQSLIRTTRALAWQGMRQAHPDASDEELDLLWLRVHYGADLAERVRTDLARRRG